MVLMGTNRNARPRLCTMRASHGVPEIDIQIEVASSGKARRTETSSPKITSQRASNLRKQKADHGHHHHDRQAARRKRHAALHRGIAEQRLQEQRQRRGAAVQNKAQR